MGLAGRFRSSRVFWVPGLAMSGGLFQGLPVRAEARARPSDSELTGVAGANCYVLRQVVRDRLGASSLRIVRICE
jgi:hypothetical protein